MVFYVYSQFLIHPFSEWLLYPPDEKLCSVSILQGSRLGKAPNESRTKHLGKNTRKSDDIAWGYLTMAYFVLFLYSKVPIWVKHPMKVGPNTLVRIQGRVIT